MELGLEEPLPPPLVAHLAAMEQAQLDLESPPRKESTHESLDSAHTCLLVAQSTESRGLLLVALAPAKRTGGDAIPQEVLEGSQTSLVEYVGATEQHLAARGEGFHTDGAAAVGVILRRDTSLNGMPAQRSQRFQLGNRWHQSSALS